MARQVVDEALHATLDHYAAVHKVKLGEPEEHGIGKLWRKGDVALYVVESRGEVGVLPYEDAKRYLVTGWKPGEGEGA